MTNWRSMTVLERLEEGGIRARFCAGPDSPWFDGHFPGEPVLPGIAQLAMVFEMVEKVAGQKLKLRGVRRVRFKRVIRPCDSFDLILRKISVDDGSYSFKIMLKDEVACSGVLVAFQTE